jgi:hypothetical protein
MFASLCRHDEELAPAFRENDDAIFLCLKVNCARNEARPRLKDDALVEDSVKKVYEASSFRVSLEGQMRHFMLSDRMSRKQL